MGDEKSSPPNKTIEVVLRDLEALLRKKLGNNFIVDSFTTTNLVPPGENYGSTMLKVNADVRRDGPESKLEEMSLVAKMVPPTELQKMIFDSPFTFRKEIYMFTDIVPAFKDLERECGISESEIFDPLPKLYGSRLSLDHTEDKFDHDAVILMENLKLKNYACSDRRIGVDLAHAKSVVKALAQFHALGIAVKFKKPQLFEEFKIYAKCVLMDIKMTKEMADFVLTTVKKVPDLLPHLARIEKVLSVLDSDILYGPPDETWGTLVHTDLWVNNVMFRDDGSGNPEAVKFVDFQHYAYLNPLRDLIFFLFTSCKAEIRRMGIEDLVDLYYKEFISHLEILKCDVNLFSRDSFNEQLANAASLEYMHCAFMIIFIIMDPDTNPASKVDPELVFTVEPTNEYRERLAEITLRFIEENWI